MENTKQHRHTPMTTNKWLGTLLLLTIPLVNLYFVIYWAFVQKISQTRRNFARAVILWFVMIALIIILAIIIFNPNFEQFFDALKGIMKHFTKKQTSDIMLSAIFFRILI